MPESVWGVQQRGGSWVASWLVFDVGGVGVGLGAWGG